MTRAAWACALVAAATGCGSFEDPTIVLDLRVLAMRADPPEQLVDVDLEEPSAGEILEQLQDTTVTALVADPAASRPLRWSMTLCLLDEEGRCDLSRPYQDLGAGVIDDPETSAVPQLPNVQVFPSATLLAMITAAVEANPVEALGGVDYTVVMTVGAVDDRSTDVYAAKHLRIVPRIPIGRSANENPYVDFIDGADLAGRGVSINAARCGSPDQLVVERVSPGARITLFPVEPDGVRERYLAPTLDGGGLEVEETIGYQWLATYGAWSDEFTGGGHDALGNQSLLGSDWIAPSNVGGRLRVSLWMIQRDERFGVSWFETCIEVAP